MPRPVVAERPADWGHMMRREAKIVLPASTVLSQPTAPLMRREVKTGLPPVVAERPVEWGHMMRREAKIVVPALAPGGEVAKRSPFAVVGLLFGVLTLVGFALQAKTLVGTLLLQLPGGVDGKGKAK